MNRLVLFVYGVAAAILMCAGTALGDVKDAVVGVWRGGSEFNACSMVLAKSGPSSADINHSDWYNVAGIVCDYSVNIIPAGHPKESPYRFYSSQNRRILTKE